MQESRTYVGTKIDVTELDIGIKVFPSSTIEVEIVYKLSIKPAKGWQSEW